MSGNFVGPHLVHTNWNRISIPKPALRHLLSTTPAETESSKSSVCIRFQRGCPTKRKDLLSINSLIFFTSPPSSPSRNPGGHSPTKDPSLPSVVHILHSQSDSHSPTKGLHSLHSFIFFTPSPTPTLQKSTLHSLHSFIFFTPSPNPTLQQNTLHSIYSQSSSSSPNPTLQQKNPSLQVWQGVETQVGPGWP